MVKSQWLLRVDTLICARIRVMRCNPRPRGIQGAGVVGMVETAVTCKPIHKSADLLSVRFSKSSRSILSRIYKLTLHFVPSMRENRCLPTHFPSPTPLSVTVFIPAPTTTPLFLHHALGCITDYGFSLLGARHIPRFQPTRARQGQQPLRTEIETLHIPKAMCAVSLLIVYFMVHNGLASLIYPEKGFRADHNKH